MKDLNKENKSMRISPVKISTKSVEKVFTWGIVIFGVIGSIIILESMTFKKNRIGVSSIYNDPIYDNRSDATKAIPLLTASEPMEKEKIIGRQLHVRGPLEANTPVLFQVENYNQNAEYLLEFGDGIRRILNQRTDSHIYEVPGNYNVKLYITYEGNRIELSSQNINIMEPITVSTNAVRIDF